MIFSSMIFLWLFLPIVFAGYYLVDQKFKNVLLLLASLLFYAWGEPVYILLILISIAINWGIGLLMEHFSSAKKGILAAGIAANVLILGYFKYFNFLIEIINRLLNIEIEQKNIAMPLGISFFTFKILSYLIDLYRGKYKAQKNIIDLALYISFFPQIMAGPIARYDDMKAQLSNRQQTAEKAMEGIRLFIYGLAKKIIIANTLAECADKIFMLDYYDLTGAVAWVGSILYTLQIYYDFSGYSDMAIGLGKLFGFDIQNNFNYPYISTSIQEFWQRWHISLGTWFREYIYIPLGGNRKGKIRTNLNLLVVFFVTGLWHGASFNFILWGLYHGIFSILERLGLKKVLEKSKIIAHIYTLLIVNFGWVLFKADNITAALRHIKRMILPWNYMTSSYSFREIIGTQDLVIALIAILGSGFLTVMYKQRKINHKWKYSYLELSYCAILLVFCYSRIASSTYNPFIYFRF